MKITNDLNNNSDFLSMSNKGEENTSLLGSLFSMNINSDEVKSNDSSDEFEFVFKKEDIEILDYLSNIIPNLNIFFVLLIILSLKSSLFIPNSNIFHGGGFWNV